MVKVDKTKKAECIQCGKEIDIHIYASPKVAKCDSCKNGESTPESIDNDYSAEHGGGEGEGPRIDGKPNKALENLCCPFHFDLPMKIVGVIRSPQWGDLISLQCRKEGCWTVVQISEQQRKAGPLRTKGHGDGWEPDLSQKEIKEKLANGELTKWWEESKI